jgi:hypothetical protein
MHICELCRGSAGATGSVAYTYTPVTWRMFSRISKLLVPLHQNTACTCRHCRTGAVHVSFRCTVLPLQDWSSARIIPLYCLHAASVSKSASQLTTRPSAQFRRIQFYRHRSLATYLHSVSHLVGYQTQADSIYFDLSGAFGTVPHTLCLHKLHGTYLASVV